MCHGLYHKAAPQRGFFLRAPQVCDEQYVILWGGGECYCYCSGRNYSVFFRWYRRTGGRVKTEVLYRYVVARFCHCSLLFFFLRFVWHALSPLLVVPLIPKCWVFALMSCAAFIIVGGSWGGVMVWHDYSRSVANNLSALVYSTLPTLGREGCKVVWINVRYM